MNADKESIKETADRCWKLVWEFYGRDDAKTLFWFTTKNYELGTRPITMIYKGKGGRLLIFIKARVGGGNFKELLK